MMADPSRRYGRQGEDHSQRPKDSPEPADDRSYHARILRVLSDP
jgi:hypothetical protein